MVDVSRSTWLTAPVNREAFWRVREIAPTTPIVNSSGRVHRFPERPVDLTGIAVPTRDGDGEWDSTETLGEHLVRTHSDGLCVVRDGTVRYEWRPPESSGASREAGHPTSRHLLMSVSKSLCATVLGAAVGRGDVALSDRVADVAPEFGETSVADATVRHLIDMTAGTDFVEDYDLYADPDSDHPSIEYERQANFRPLKDMPSIGVMAHFRIYAIARPHGAWFDYRSPLTNVVARVLECATGTGYAALLSRDLWGPAGAEHDADIVVDPLGFPIAEAGISCSLRDLARVGLAHVGDGTVGDARVVPEEWVRDCVTIDETSKTAFESAPAGDGRRRASWEPRAYRNAWWQVESGNVFTAQGIFGQFCWIHRPSRTVIARFSTWPEAAVDDHTEACLRAFGAIVEAL